MKKTQDLWFLGYACALAYQHRMYHATCSIGHQLYMEGFTIARLKEAGVEKYDLDELKKCLKGYKKYQKSLT